MKIDGEPIKARKQPRIKRDWVRGFILGAREALWHWMPFLVGVAICFVKNADRPWTVTLILLSGAVFLVVACAFTFADGMENAWTRTFSYQGKVLTGLTHLYRTSFLVIISTSLYIGTMLYMTGCWKW